MQQAEVYWIWKPASWLIDAAFAHYIHMLQNHLMLDQCICQLFHLAKEQKNWDWQFCLDIVSRHSTLGLTKPQCCPENMWLSGVKLSPEPPCPVWSLLSGWLVLYLASIFHASSRFSFRQFVKPRCSAQWCKSLQRGCSDGWGCTHFLVSALPISLFSGLC